MSSTLVLWHFTISLKHRPISFLLTEQTATISLNVLGTPSCLQAMYRHAAAMAAFALPFSILPSYTVLNGRLALSVMVLGKLILSDMVVIKLKASLRALSV